ncbi:MAG: SDR family NAD(P)-dependent oxidoreductase [Halieaceae bacterium]|jgi:NAD(P)-dependent dehydrogenase (short-subunit alcohol dehydrogenase family)|nr:SDR family NAD(P)-dependent oxidoreductase [Halieaceae bacterium]
MNTLNGKVAFITGARRGIGGAIAKRFAAEGACVVMGASGISNSGGGTGPDIGEAVETINQSGGKAAFVVADLSRESERADLITRAQEHFGPLDILVNNAAAADMILPSLASVKQRNTMYDLNLNAPIDLAQQVLPGMRERKAGWILNISSSSAQQPVVPYPYSPIAAHVIGPYGATKAALDRYTEALAHEVAADSVFINTLAPESIVLTSGAEFVRDIARKRPDMLEPVEMMAEAALALCSHSITGQVCYSRQVLHMLNLPLKTLDGRSTMGDALFEADAEAPGC